MLELRCAFVLLKSTEYPFNHYALPGSAGLQAAKKPHRPTQREAVMVQALKLSCQAVTCCNVAALRPGSKRKRRTKAKEAVWPLANDLRLATTEMTCVHRVEAEATAECEPRVCVAVFSLLILTGNSSCRVIWSILAIQSPFKLHFP